MAWTPQNSLSHFVYGAGTWSRYYWDPSYNPGATFNLCLPNCTTLAYGRPLENGYPAPVTEFRNAQNWHLYVNTGEDWYLMTYTSGMALIPGDIVEWSNGENHVAVVETTGTDPYISGSWYTSRSSSLVGGNTMQDVSDYFSVNYPTRFYHYKRLSWENANGGHGHEPDYVIRYGGSPTPPPTPTETLDIQISPSSYSKTMNANEDYLDFTFGITITGIPAGDTVSGGNTYPGLTRVSNTGWSYSDYVVNGITYRSATKTQTLRYQREYSYAYTTVKYMYFNITKSTGTINTSTPMYIDVKAKKKTGLIAILCRRRKRGMINVI